MTELMNRFHRLLKKFVAVVGSLKLALGSLLFAGLMAAIAALLFFAWLADEMNEGDTGRFDESVRNYIHEFASPTLTKFMQAASFSGSTLFLVSLGAAVLLVCYFLNRRRAALIFALTTVGSALLTTTLKLAFKRARPEPFFNTILPSSDSFPSGHSLSSFCFYLPLAAIITVRIKNRAVQILIWLTAIFMVLTIGISRIYLGVHHASDVVAGFAVGLIWVMTITVADKLIHVRDKGFTKN